MKAAFLLATLFILGSMNSNAQSTKEKLEKVKADPKTKDRAAKADVYVVKQDPIIADSTTKTNAPANTPTTNKKKKKKSI